MQVAQYVIKNLDYVVKMIKNNRKVTGDEEPYFIQVSDVTEYSCVLIYYKAPPKPTYDTVILFYNIVERRIYFICIIPKKEDSDEIYAKYLDPLDEYSKINDDGPLSETSFDAINRRMIKSIVAYEQGELEGDYLSDKFIKKLPFIKVD